MRELFLSDRRGLRPLPLTAWAATGMLSMAILANAFYGQPPGSRSEAALTANGASVRLEVEAPGGAGRTIQLRYDPVVESVQRELLAAGYYKGAVDGVIGRKTKQAIEDYQRSAGIGIDGKPTSGLAEHIRYTREVAEASLFTGSIDPDPAAEARAMILRVQTGLSELAYNPGGVDGQLTEQTRSAIREFQRDRKMDETGEVSGELLTELAKMSGQSEMVTPEALAPQD
jgi:peptidoglycan hydrolase-like protein with peptidoglycan-binding domain